MFVRKKVKNGRTYHYLVRCVRRDGRVKQETLCYMGETATVEEALATWPEQIRGHLEAQAKHRAEAERLEKCCPGYGARWWKGVPRPDARRYRRGANVPIFRYWVAVREAESHGRLAAERAGQLDKLKAALATRADSAA